MMGFWVRIEVDGGREVLSNWHPEGKSHNGKAVFAFLMGLQTFCSSARSNEKDVISFEPGVNWFRQLEQTAQVQFCSACRALLDCMWGDGGDHTIYREDDYDFYIQRTGHSAVTKEEFQTIIRESQFRWKPIEDVISSVQILLNVFYQTTPSALEGFYEAEVTNPDFETLHANLKLLAQRGAETVRLNFF